MADRSSNIGDRDAQIIKLLAIRKSIQDETARRRRRAEQDSDNDAMDPSATDWDKGYAQGLRDAIDVISGIRPVAGRMDAESCLDGISAIFNYMSVPRR